MLLLGTDFETTGLEMDRHAIVEVGMIMWDTKRQTPTKLMGYFVNPGPGVEWDPEATAKTGITQELVEEQGYESLRGLKQFLAWYEQADYICAHNGAVFDRRMLNAWIKRCGLDYEAKKHWIDTNHDLESYGKSRHLPYMAADHGFLNPFPHRAVFDVMTMFKIAVDYDWEKTLAVSLSPTNIYMADIPFERGPKTPLKDAAKEFGFRARYENDKFVRWELNAKECHAAQMFEGAAFPIKLVGPLVVD